MPTVKNVGEPCAGEPHARIDGGREETSVSRQRRAMPGASRLPDQPLAELGERLASRGTRSLKTNGSARSLGTAAVENKVVQRAVDDLFSAIYEADLFGCSYGFRPRRSRPRRPTTTLTSQKGPTRPRPSPPPAQPPGAFRQTIALPCNPISTIDPHTRRTDKRGPHRK